MQSTRSGLAAQLEAATLGRSAQRPVAPPRTSSVEHVKLPEGSISKTPSVADQSPQLEHTLHTADSVLSIAVSSKWIFSGSPQAYIEVWDRESLRPIQHLEGHDGAVSAMLVVEEREWLVSGSSDGSIRIWCLANLVPLLLVLPITPGRIYSLAWDSSSSTLYCGCQSTTIQWITLPARLSASPSNPFFPQLSTSQPKPSRFFDSCPPSAAPTPRSEHPPPQVTTLFIADECCVVATHGYVYALAIVQNCSSRHGDETWLASGSGSGDVNIWAHTKYGELELRTTFAGGYEAVLSLTSSDQTLFAGMQDGGVKIFDLETKSLIRIVVGHEASVLSLARVGSDLYSLSSDGRMIVWNSSFDCKASLQAHNAAILSSAVAPPTANGTSALLTGGIGGRLHLWTLGPSPSPAPSNGKSTVEPPERSTDVLLGALSKFISFPTVPVDSHREDCRQGAIFLKRTLTQLGAEASLLPGAPGKNPLVLATFRGKQPPAGSQRKRVLFYGHYDVVQVDPSAWTSDPWTMDGRNGYLYGRGVADNKGPILAIATAASALLERRALDLDLVLLIEGEEEAGSEGLKDAVQANKASIGDIDCILVSNSTWIGEDRPCLTYGLRGVAHVSLEISSDQPDLHSGVEGGAAAEPMIDMIRLLGALSDAEHHVKVPRFYDAVRSIDAAEQKLYASLSSLTGRTASNLKKRFSEPSFSVGNVRPSSGSGGPTVIPARVQASLSFRLVPDQDVDSIVDSIVAFLRQQFALLHSPHHLSIAIPHKADWWLGDLSSLEFTLMERCVADVWAVPTSDVLRIREGGSIPSIPFLEKEFSSRAIHLPLGQSSDNGHLKDERLRLLNLRNGAKVFEAFLEKLPGLSQSS